MSNLGFELMQIRVFEALSFEGGNFALNLSSVEISLESEKEGLSCAHLPSLTLNTERKDCDFLSLDLHGQSEQAFLPLCL